MRLFSAATDGLTVLVATAIIMGIFVWQGGEIQYTGRALVVLLALMGIVSAFYHLLWCLAEGDSPGMQLAGLQLVDFDGRRPNRHQRVIRRCASLLSVCAAGVGLVWALVDDEHLTWHDHISKTFPTLVPPIAR